MGDILRFNTFTPKQNKTVKETVTQKQPVIETIGLPFEKVEDICESMKNMADVIMHLHVLAEKHLYEDLHLPAEKFTNVDISNIDVQRFLFEEKPIQVVYSGEVDGVPNRITTCLVKTKNNEAITIIFTEYFDGKDWVKYESDNFRFI